MHGGDSAKFSLILIRTPALRGSVVLRKAIGTENPRSQPLSRAHRRHVVFAFQNGEGPTRSIS